MADFDKDFWDEHWAKTHDGSPGSMDGSPPNPYLMSGTAGMTPGTALDAGCGAGAEAIWLASQGWQVTAADISADALNRAAQRAAASGAGKRIEWVEADLTSWTPSAPFDLVTTHYAHPTMPQLAFFERIAEWVAPGGTLLIVGHLHTHGAAGHGHDDHDQHPPAEASVSLADVTAVLDDTAWDVVSAEQHDRTLLGADDQSVPLNDVVLQAARRA